MGYILAFDVGTTAVKAVLIERETGKMQTAARDTAVIRKQPGWAEQDPDEMWNVVCQSSRECVLKAGISGDEVDGIVISAPWKHVIPLDRNYRPLRQSIIWMDARAKDQAERLNRAMGRYVDNAQGYWARLMWLKENEPDIWARAAHISGINSYLKYRATGNLINECSDDLIHSPDPGLQAYYDEALSAAGISAGDRMKFPEVKACTDRIGLLSKNGAEELGLAAGIPVFNGFGDLPAVYFGSGCMNEGTAHIYLGTSSWFGELLKEQAKDYSPAYFTADRDHQGALFGMTTGARAFEWIIERFYVREKEQLGPDIYQFVEEEIRGIPAGSCDLIVTHWLNGERKPLSKNGKAVFFNVTEQHDRRHFVHAMLESICYTHRRSLMKYISMHGHAPRRINIVGGGALSGTWMQIMADVLGQPVFVPDNPRYAGAMGAYRCALIGLGIERDFRVAESSSNEKRYLPDLSNKDIYDKMFEIYLDLHPSLKPLYDRINGVY